MLKRFQLLKVSSLIVLMFTVTACFEIDLEPDTAVNMLGQDHTVTATFEVSEELIIDQPIIFRVISGPNQGRESVPFSGECNPDDCRTNELGQVTWTYTSQIVGKDEIVGAFIPPGEDEPQVISFPVTKIWQAEPRPIPALSQWGLIAMAGIIGIVGLIVLRRKKVSA